MPMPRYAAKRDTAERPIIDALEADKWRVWQLDEPCDLLCWRPDKGFRTLEVKTPHGKKGLARIDKRQQEQARFLALTGTPIVRTPEEALRALGAKVI